MMSMVSLITQRSQVQILPPLQRKTRSEALPPETAAGPSASMASAARSLRLASRHQAGLDTKTVLELIRRVLAVVTLSDDGIEFVAQTATAEVIREEDDYSGVRVHVEAMLASAKLPFHVDVNVGDPSGRLPRPWRCLACGVVNRSS